ncbi:multiprotein-bridging factor 1 family protein [Streptosporangium sp. NPDC087985]|uniref:helix-turn-helix domain-containing protein n=1 Tax=Streptosporangium sp. NPDC087985 TaxID=3366196 RepID=UPI0038222E00
MESGPISASAHMFGVVLRHLRGRAKMSLRELGKQALYDYTRLSRAENGEILIPLEQVRQLDHLLNAGGTLIALREAADCDAEPRSPVLPGSACEDGPVMLELRTPDGGSVHVTMSRRQFAQLLAGGALSSLLPSGLDLAQTEPLARAIEQPTRLDADVIDYFRRLLAEHYAADKMLGPRMLLRPVLAQIDVLNELRRGARASQTEPLFQVLAQYGEMAGWLHQDIGNIDAARHWSRLAAEWAQCAGDQQMAAYMLIRGSNIACLTDDPAAVVQLASAARRSPGPLEPKLLALASQQQARGHAMLGEYGRCFTLLDEAANLLNDHPHVSDPTAPLYLHHYDLDTLQEQSAVCHRTSGHADAAVTILENQITKTAENLARDRGHLTAKLAVAVSQASRPDPSRATHLGLTALGIAQQTGSARIMRELHTLDDELQTRWPGRKENHALHDALGAVRS